MNSQSIRTPGGRELVAVGDEGLLTLDRLEGVFSHFDQDPRVCSVSLVSTPLASGHQTWQRGTAPTGPVTLIAADVQDLVGPMTVQDEQSVIEWCTHASERGLWNDWWHLHAADVLRSSTGTQMSDIDLERPVMQRPHLPTEW